MLRGFRALAAALLVGTAMLLNIGARAAEAKREPFGALADGRQIESVILSNKAGIRVRIMTLGAAIQSLSVPDRSGQAGDIVLGFDSPQGYLQNPSYFGATVGRFANRIAKGRFTLDGKDYTLATNDHGNHLHGGLKGFDKVVWSIESFKSASPATAVFSYTSPDGEEGYPGTLHVTASYSLNDAATLRVEFKATTDKSTIVNISNHSYFNLSAETGAPVLSHLLLVNASKYTPVDAGLIPTGELRAVAGTPFDFRKATAIGTRVRDGRDQQIRYGRGYDHNFALDGTVGELRLAARVADPSSGRIMEIFSKAPGLQFYSGNFLDATIAGKGGRLYREGDALVLEPQLFPDAPNQKSFPSARLDPGSTYVNTMEYRFSTDKPARPPEVK
ncbi:MAG TPA: aldose epimerase family protein [Steroidobacteraceae bacterium]|nr:aldose epimerase family protein [Steroidobacteraceae bacterium]